MFKFSNYAALNAWTENVRRVELHSIAFLKAWLSLTRDQVNAGKKVPQEEICASEILIVVKHIVDSIEYIVRKVRFPECCRRR